MRFDDEPEDVQTAVTCSICGAELQPEYGDRVITCSVCNEVVCEKHATLCACPQYVCTECVTDIEGEHYCPECLKQEQGGEHAVSTDQYVPVE